MRSWSDSAESDHYRRRSASVSPPIASERLKDFVVAKRKKKAAKKKAAKKAAGKASAAKKRAASEAAKKKKAKKAAPKKAAKQTSKKAATKATQQAPRKAPKKTLEKTLKKTQKPAKTAKPPSAPKEPSVVAKTPRAPKPARTGAAAEAPRAVAPVVTAKNSFYITTAIAYPNGNPHIGHAYEAIATDALARFQRLDGKDVFFLTGTDEHGLKMVQTAEAEKLPTSEVARRNAGRFRAMDERLNVSFDRFIRTTEEQHHRSSQEIWQRMAANGDIYLDRYAGWYSVRDEAYYAEDETVLGEDNVRRGPQGSPVEWVEENSYFFRLSAYQD